MGTIEFSAPLARLSASREKHRMDKNVTKYGSLVMETVLSWRSLGIRVASHEKKNKQISTCDADLTPTPSHLGAHVQRSRIPSFKDAELWDCQIPAETAACCACLIRNPLKNSGH